MHVPRPFFRKQTRSYYVQLRGQQIPLGKDQKQANLKYHQLMAGQRDIGPDPIFRELCAEFLAAIKPKVAERTYDFYKQPLEEFCEFIGTLRISKLRPHHVERWVASKYPNTNNGSTIRNAIRPAQRVLNWARKSGRLERSPLDGMEKPSESVRDFDVTPEQFSDVLNAIKQGPFRDFVIILRETRCRVKEARIAEARHFDKFNRCWRFPIAESKGRIENRIVLLNNKAFQITKRCADKYPVGPLFRNRDGKPWTNSTLDARLRQLKLNFRITPSIIRHVFATETIVRGVDILTIAELMGHRSLKMLQRTYSKIRKRSEHLRAALIKATG